MLILLSFNAFLEKVRISMYGYFKLVNSWKDLQATRGGKQNEHKYGMTHANDIKTCLSLTFFFNLVNHSNTDLNLSNTFSVSNYFKHLYFTIELIYTYR